ncbi:SDR family NAD(P)-dependent oxidoreductase [Oribacterium sp. HCP28S3_H8]|uniref:SDR family NAD(P)-dependent oxidoreductase n=1 Tax=Oribacterium sp. HCP28S3_H8 TaxID=3438945 RepID=UPI003F8A0D78
MYLDLQNKVAIVTGGSSGIGRGIAERFADEGVNVVITGRHEDFLKKVADDGVCENAIAPEQAKYVTGSVFKVDGGLAV